MGLFSKFGKKEQRSTEDSGYYRAADDRALTERARSKRAASNEAGATRARGRKDAPDPVLPEKKRARRRLVGAIALALAVAIGLPMVLDSEPKPLANDISIQIPSKDKPADDTPPAPDKSKPAQAEALDQTEEIVEPADEPGPPPKLAAAPVKAEPKPEAKVEAKVEPKKVEPPKVAEHKPEPEKKETKPEPKKVAAEVKPEAKPEPKKEAKPEARHADAKAEPKSDDSARALALLEGKAPAAAPADSGRYVIQVAALSAKDKVEELQGKLRDAGIKSFTQKSPSGDLTRVKVGPFGSREEAEKARAKLQKLGLSGSLVPA